ncbi:ribbon-helix-helix domain-containing protein [Azospirillum argentinense]|uniref:ribbon-helix-helix domain-containing protein n=1 Tax=Azospirillum argentinense TaxID=2970906 RepID=UPI0032DF13C0
MLFDARGFGDVSLSSLALDGLRLSEINAHNGFSVHNAFKESGKSGRRRGMCRIFAGQDPERFRMVTRRVRLSGHSTSVCLEAAFWDALEEIAAMQGVSLGRFLSKLHDEVLARGVERRNFAGLLRCACLTYAQEVKGHRPCVEELEREARTDFAAVAAAGLPARIPAAVTTPEKERETA